MNISSRAKQREPDLDSSNELNKTRGNQEDDDPKSTSNEAKTRNKLKFLLKATTKLDAIFEHVDCYGQEIPCIRSVRELSRRLKTQLGNDYGTFNRVLVQLAETDVRGIPRVVTRVETLRVLVGKMARDEGDYLKNMEDARQCLGEMTGLVETILNIDYGKRSQQ